jgi:citrate synthase
LSEGFWRTSISQIEPDEIRIRGYDIGSLIQRATFGDVVYLLLKGEWPQGGEGRLVEAILVSCCDHSLEAPSTDATRLVASCGVPLPSAVAAGILAIGDYHAGAIEGCARTLLEGLPEEEADLARAADRLVAAVRGRGERLLGYGHPVHREDPRVRPLFEIAEGMGLARRWVDFAWEVERALREQVGRPLPINVDGAIGALLLEMGLDWRVGKAFFLLSRAAGLSAHYLEQVTRERPFKAPHYDEIVYDGPPPRDLEED